MPKAVPYRSGSVIYFQGDLNDKIFILQGGKVSLKYTDIETGQDVHELIQTGEFFGVKSALGKYPREENAQVLQDSTVLVFTVPEFEQFSMANTRIIMKMLKVFSNQLRRVHKQVETLLEKDESVIPEFGLFRTGEYYLKTRQYQQAKYVFSRYLTYYPAGKCAQEASRNLELAENAFARYGQGKGPSVIMTKGSSSEQVDAGQSAPSEAPKAEVNHNAGLSDVAKMYYNAVSLFSQQKIQEAFKEFKKIVEAASDEEYTAKSYFELGRCLFMLNQLDATINHFSRMLQTYPKHPDIADALFYVGQAYEKKLDKARAATFYKKILTMQSDEDSSTRIKAKKALKGIEG